MIVSSPRVGMSLILLIKSVVSFTNDSIFVTSGFRKISTKAEIFSVAQPLALTIGLPGGGSVPLCIFGRK